MWGIQDKGGPGASEHLIGTERRLACRNQEIRKARRV